MPADVFDYRNCFSLDGKVALVTGAAGSLGAEMCRGLAAAGASVLVTDISSEGGEALVKELCGTGAKAEFFQLDVTIESQWEVAIAMAVDRFGGLDAVVNNAGIVPMQFISDIDDDEFRQVQNVNVNGVFLGCKHAVRAMRPGGISGRGGSIINLSSIMGLTGSIAVASYNASKGAVRLLSKSVAVECAQLGFGVRCNSLHPGIIDSDMGDHFLQSLVDLGLAPDMEASKAGFSAAIPAGSPGKPQDIAAGVVYLASDASGYMTGSELVIDGGYNAI